MNELPQPSRPLTVDEFLASLDQSNPLIRKVRSTFERNCGSVMLIYKKDSALYENVKGRLSMFRLPIVDKPLQIVVEARDSHEAILGALYCYHSVGAGHDPDMYDSRIWGEMYVKQGHGYYYSGAWGNQPTVIIADHVYKPDRFDKDLLGELGLGR